MTAVSDSIAPHIDSGAIVGAVALVGRGESVTVTVIGDQELGGSPMREDSLFRIASVGKPITAAAALTLVADGRIDLDDPVGELLPEISDPRVLQTAASPLEETVAAIRPITVRDLLRSTSGLGFSSEYSDPVMTLLTEKLHQGSPRPQLVPPPDEWMAILSEIPLLHQPGEGFTYNTAFDILGVLIERASGQSLGEYVSERIFDPLSMADSGFSYPENSDERRTTLYRLGEQGELIATDPPDGQWVGDPVFASGAGGYLSTVADLLSFQRMLLAGGGEVLPQSLVTQMMRDQLTPAIRATDSVFLDGQSWGFGGGVDIAVRSPWNVIGRFGWVGGTGTSAHIVPSDGSIAILLTQTELGGPEAAAVLESFWAAAAGELGHDN